jgi:hypothetical protein
VLSPDEFTVGTLEDAKPLSLILPRAPFEYVALVGRIEDTAAAVILSGDFAFHVVERSGTSNLNGLIIPAVRIEVDETSLFDPSYGAAVGCVIRRGTALLLRAKCEHHYTGGMALTLHEGLAPAATFSAGFTQWQVVIGRGDEKRVLWRTSDKEAMIPAEGR